MCTTETYCDCGELLDQDCMGNPRCPVCDGPCPCCSDGPGFGWDDDSDDDTTEPGDDDYTLTPSGPLGSRVSVSAGGKHLGEYSEVEHALGAIREDMETNQYWPAIWWISDHGNCWMMDLDGNEI